MSKKVKDGYWWARFVGPLEIVLVKDGKVYRCGQAYSHLQHEFKFEGEVVGYGDQESSMETVQGPG